MSKKKREKISFIATKKIPKKVNVSFQTRKGDSIEFRATKKVPKKVKVEFYAKKRK